MSNPFPRIDRRKIIYTAAKGVRDGWRLRGHISSVLQNGVGRYVCQLQRLTIGFCRSYEGSYGVRQFIEEDLLNFANDNPGVAIYVEPQRHKRPFVDGEYLNGRRVKIGLHDMDRKEVNVWVNYMRTRSGNRITAFEQEWRTENPSIQGMWHPFLHVPSQMNVTKFPSDKVAQYYSPIPSATENVIKLLQEQKMNIKFVEETTPVEKESSSS